MICGGIPHYLKELNPAESGIQNIDRICFDQSGLLHDEFSRLYPSLFDSAERHMTVVRALGKHTYGLNRTQILKETKMKDGGGMTRILDELEFSGFIKSFYPFKGKKNGKIYRLIDEYSFFYLRFIEPNREQGAGTWLTHSQTPSYRAWSGYAFENVGLRHLPQIKKALGIGSVATVSSTFYHKGKDGIPGLQIDLVLSRADRAINLCEFKFHNRSLALSSSEAAKYLERLQVFRELTGTNHVLFNSLISTFGLSKAENAGGAIAQSITMEALFEAV